MANDFIQYRRTQIAEMRPWKFGDDMEGVSISKPDSENGSPRDGDMIARNPKNHADQWLVAAQYFADNFEPMERRPPPPAVEGGWREIASAPKDGTRFLTFDDHYGVRMGRAFIRADHDDWLSYVDCNGNSSKGGIRATHWQPLPAPPAGEKP